MSQEVLESGVMDIHDSPQVLLVDEKAAWTYRLKRDRIHAARKKTETPDAPPSHTFVQMQR